MNIRNTKELKTFASQRLEAARDEKHIVLIYSALALGIVALTTVVNYLLGLKIDQSGGLGNLGTRSFLSTLQTVLPLVQSVAVMCLDVGYIAAMLRIARGQYASPQSLRLGFDRFWVLLRCAVIRGLIYVAILFAAVYLSTMLYMITPLSRSAMEILMPLMSSTTVLDSGIVIDDATYTQLVASMWPLFLICCAVFCAAATPVMYRYRMANYVIIDHPGLGAIAALRESRKMMKGNCFQLFKLDLGLWYYYAALLIASIICYGDMILPMLGVNLPFSEDAAYFIFYALCLALEFGIYYFLRNRAEVAYALAYDAVKPEEKKDSGVVLGNIFNL